MPRMAWTMILPDAPGLRATPSVAAAPTRPTPMAAPRQPRPPWMLPDISARMLVMVGVCLVGFPPCAVDYAPGGKGLVGVVMFAVAVVANEADVDAHEQ